MCKDCAVPEAWNKIGNIIDYDGVFESFLGGKALWFINEFFDGALYCRVSIVIVPIIEEWRPFKNSLRCVVVVYVTHSGPKRIHLKIVTKFVTDSITPPFLDRMTNCTFVWTKIKIS